MPNRAHLVVIGAGVIGLAHAAEALERGYQVTVIDRDHRAVGASVRNFGHICITAQGGAAYELARAGRAMWLKRSQQAGFWLTESGTVVVATTENEVALLSEFFESRPDTSQWVEGAELTSTFGIINTGKHTRALYLPEDLRVHPREVVPKIASWLAREGVDFRWATMVTSLDAGVVHTSRGTFEADQIVVAVNHDIDYLLPDVSYEFDFERCALQMLRVETATPHQVPSAVLSGTSMLRYDGFKNLPSRQSVLEEIDAQQPILLASACNLMTTQLPDGSFLLGDTHVYGETVGPFMSGEWADMLLRNGSQLLGVEFNRISEYWQGTYLSSRLGGLMAKPNAAQTHMERPRHEYGAGQIFHYQPFVGVDVVSALSGIGMTTAFGLAERVSQQW